MDACGPNSSSALAGVPDHCRPAEDVCTAALYSLESCFIWKKIKEHERFQIFAETVKMKSLFPVGLGHSDLQVGLSGSHEGALTAEHSGLKKSFWFNRDYTTVRVNS